MKIKEVESYTKSLALYIFDEVLGVSMKLKETPVPLEL